MVDRALLPRLQARLDQTPCLALMGASRVGKSVLADMLSDRMGGVLLDLGRADHLAMLQPNPSAFLTAQAGRLLILDGIHQNPPLFDLLRGQVELRQRQGIQNGHFVLLGENTQLRAMASERLAGHLAMVEVPGLLPLDLPQPALAIVDDRMAVEAQSAMPAIDVHADVQRLWHRGGFPQSFLAGNDQASFEWRSAYLQALTGRPFAIDGEPVAEEAVQRAWNVIASFSGAELSIARITDALGCNGINARRFVDAACNLRALRVLPRRMNTERQRQKANPKIYFRDSGLLHACLGLATEEAVAGHEIAGNSWEGFALEAIVAASPFGTRHSWYRADNNEEELDVVVEREGHVWGIEIKKNRRPGVSKGFYAALKAVNAERAIVVYRGEDRYVPDKSVEFMALRDAMTALMAF